MKFDLDSLIKRLKIDPAKLSFLKKLGGGRKAEGAGPAPVAKPAPPLVDTRSSLTRAAVGSTMMIEEFYFPPDIIGGMCPQVPGAEEETAWNAAAEACDTERVHIVWQSFDSRVWYLAIRSADLASHANSWCPFAALLPGMNEALTPPVCYTYYGDEIASMMTVTEDGLHVYRGTNPIVRAKAERTARELGNAAIIDLVPETIVAYVPVPWFSVSLFEERARRILAATSVAVSMALTGLSFLVWLLASVALVASRHNLNDAMARTQSKTVELLNAAQDLRATPVREALTKFVDLNEGLLDLNGYLEVYAIKGNQARWRATVPSNITADRINALGGKTMATKPNGTVIGNAAEIDFEASGAKKMKPNIVVLLKALSPRLMFKAIQTFDRMTLLIISACWAATIVVMIIALYTISLSVSAEREAETALATEPALPKINRTALGGKEIQVMIDRLKKRYPDINIKWDSNLLVLTGANGASYHQWLTAIGQVDTVYPQFHWKIQAFCVGTLCGGQSIMAVDLAGEKVSLEMPQASEKK